jgi:hypothetical protein
MEIFSASDWYEIPGRGWVAIIDPVGNYDPQVLVNQLITISGSRYLVKGVETPAIPNPTGKVFGLLVAGPL